MHSNKLEALHPDLARYVQKCDGFQISAERLVVLDFLINKIVDRLKDHSSLNLNFICTHNSRRSQISQIWSQLAAYVYDIPIDSFSGGVEVTAFNPRAVRAMRKAGFQIVGSNLDNPKYQVSFTDKLNPQSIFSKTFDDLINPKDNFFAILTCAHADENCPFIPGATERIPLRYKDPKVADDTPEEESKYDERVLQIGAEMFYIFSSIAKKLI